ncbi:unnamed protein product [Cuscuta campestris]|uniref:Uncharacterized protein n=1 Tax=Cuscuta campestris TaxID=132261 RepID=A0A484MWR6_9ASTE|nr:unnamed protein product [Cuscuta campestris]
MAPSVEIVHEELCPFKLKSSELALVRDLLRVPFKIHHPDVVGPKKRRAARNKLNKSSSSSSTPNPIVSTNINPDNNEVIPKVTTCCVEHGSKDVVESVKEVKEDQHVLMVECDNVVVGAAAGGGGVEEDDNTNNNNGVNGSPTAGAQKGEDEGGVSSVVAAAAAEAEEDNAASSDVKKVTLGGFKDECPLKEYHEMNQMNPKVAESSLEIPHDDAGADASNTTLVSDDDHVAVGGDCVEDDDYNAVKGNEIVPRECVSEVGAVEDKGTFRSKNEDSGFSVVKEMLCAGFKDECAFEEYFGKVLALVDEFDATSTKGQQQQQFKDLLLLHKDLIKKGALSF